MSTTASSAAAAPARTGFPWVPFRTAVLVLVLVGAAVRVGGALTGPPCVVTDDSATAAEAAAEGRCVSYNDSVTYLTDARLNADGHWFQTREGDAEPVDTALHAPGFALLLTPLVWLGIDTYDGLRMAVAVLGAAGVAAVALLGRRLGGDRVGVVAGAIAALHPLVWVNDVVLMPEGLMVVGVVGVALLAYRVHDDPTPANAVRLGLAIGAVTLWRNEALSALAFVALPVLLGHRHLASRARVARLALVVAATALVLAPWVAYNQARFDRLALTNGVGAGLRVGTCDETFYNDHLLGLRSVDCLEKDGAAIREPANDNEVGRSRVFQEGAVEYYQDNLGRAPVVVLARVTRFWGVWRPFESVRLDDAIEQRGAQRSQVGVVVGWALLPFSVYGAVVLWRRRVPLSPLLGWVATSTLLAAANQPLQRFRIGGDVGLAVLAAVGLMAALQVPTVRRLLGLDPPDPAEDGVAADPAEGQRPMASPPSTGTTAPVT